MLTLRADFQPVLQSIPGFHTRLNERLYLLSPLTPEQMREAMEYPAAARGVAFEPGLVDQILSDAAGGALPLLEFTLTKLWETQRHKTLTFVGYHEMGGVRGALDRFAEEKAAQLAEPAAEVIDRVLLRLVRNPGGGPDLAVRQRVFQSEVSDSEWEVLQRLAEARLVILDAGAADREPYAELAHESLITAWRRLRDLVAENAEFLSWLARVQQRAADGDPLPEARIAEARRWLDARPGDIPGGVRGFIEHSETAAEMRLRDLRDARDRAEAAREQAEVAACRAEALRLAADAELALRTAPHGMIVSLALGTESVLVEPTLQGDLALRQVLRLHPRTWPGWTATARWSRWRSARMAPGWPPPAATGRRGCSTRPPGRSWPGWTTTAWCTRWRSARMAPGWPPPAATGRRGCSTRPPGPSWPGWTTTDRVNAVAFSPDGDPGGHRQQRPVGAGVRRGHRDGAGPAGPRQAG